MSDDTSIFGSPIPATDQDDWTADHPEHVHYWTMDTGAPGGTLYLLMLHCVECGSVLVVKEIWEKEDGT